MRRALLLFTVSAMPMHAASACFATVEAAARNSVSAVAEGSSTGFRADGLIVDQVLGRGWLRVVDCAHPERPAQLIGIGAPLRTSFVQNQAAPPRTEPPALPAGSAVSVTVSGLRVRMSLHGHTEASARVGQPVTVQLDRAAGDGIGAASQRVEGTLTAAGSVEVSQ